MGEYADMIINGETCQYWTIDTPEQVREGREKAEGKRGAGE